MKKGFLKRLWRFLRGILLLTGAAVIVAVLLAFTPVYWHLYHWLGEDEYELGVEPDYIVVLGGGGIPSASGLMRTYHAAQVGGYFRRAKIIVSLPAEEGVGETATERMKNEIVMRGIRPGRVLMETQGRNTREQALRVRAMLAQEQTEPAVLLITSPGHMKRSLLSFRKVGFTRVAGSGASDDWAHVDITYKDEELGGKGRLLPDVGESMMLRYHFWSNLGFAGGAARELLALSYYWCRGWI